MLSVQRSGAVFKTWPPVLTTVRMQEADLRACLNVVAVPDQIVLLQLIAQRSAAALKTWSSLFLLLALSISLSARVQEADLRACLSCVAVPDQFGLVKPA